MRASHGIAPLLLLIWPGAVYRNISIGIEPTVLQAGQYPPESPVSLPNQQGSFKFSILGDCATTGADRARSRKRRVRFMGGSYCGILTVAGGWWLVAGFPSVTSH